MPKNTKGSSSFHHDAQAARDTSDNNFIFDHKEVIRAYGGPGQARPGTSYNVATPSPSHGPPASSIQAQNHPLSTHHQQRHSNMAQWKHWRPRSIWSSSYLILTSTMLAIAVLLLIVRAFLTRHLDPKGCGMCWSRPMYIKYADFDTEHTRFASKYGLYVIKEGGIDEDPKVRLESTAGPSFLTLSQVKGVPILFIPGNAGSYKQARCLEFESAHFFNSMIQQDPNALLDGGASLDFFSVDFNEDFSAFHGQTLLDQAEYVNDAVAYILSLYHDPRRSQRDPDLPDPSSVILIGHSMGGLVARAMLTMPNYQSNSINTIITMSTPHARAPVSVDADLVHAYDKVNDYWRRAHLQEWANDNPLWHVTLISIAGGGLDTVVPSDYASVESIIPGTHGFTVFTSGIPRVWTGSDHIQTTWCVQLMKSISHSIFEIVDVRRPSQTKPRSERMRAFKKWYLTGMEEVIEKSSPLEEIKQLSYDEGSENVFGATRRLTLRELGHDTSPRAYFFPMQPKESSERQRFVMLSDQAPNREGSNLEVLLCRSQADLATNSAFRELDSSIERTGTVRLACKTARPEIVLLPASTRLSVYPFDKVDPFTFLQYGASDLAEYSCIALLDKSPESQSGWALAELSALSNSATVIDVGLRHLLAFGLHTKLPAERPLVTELHIPALHSSLLAFNLVVGPQTCGEDAELFTPLLRQFIEEPYESKFVVNLKTANVSLHGIAPFMPPPLRDQVSTQGVTLQFWSDPTCNSSIDVSLYVDVLGSLGKLVMRYRLVFAAFPLLVVALILRKQFATYDDTGKTSHFGRSITSQI